MLRKSRKRLCMSVLLCFFIVASSFSAFGAQYFTDVKNDHWAKNFIDKLTEKGIVRGFEDATFRPDDSVSKTATISMIYQMLKQGGKVENVRGLIEKHQKTLENTGIQLYADWAKEPIAYALEKNIIHADELKTFFKNGKNVEARRIDVAIFLAKALSNGNISNSTIIILPFTDSDFIPSASAKYVNYLVEKKIINEKGDYMGRFNPSNSISRAEISTMISLASDQFGSNGGNVIINPTPSPDPIVVVPKDEIKEGNITYIDSSTKSIVVKFSDGKTDLFQIDSGVEIKLNGSVGTYSDLQVNQEATITLKEGKGLSKVEVKSFVPNMEATLNAVVPNTGFTLLVVRENSTNTVKSLKAIAATKIELNGLPVALDKLKIGDILKLRVDGQNIVSISAVSKIKTYQGVLESEVSSIDNPVLRVKIDNEIKEFAVDKNAKITKNGYSRWLKDLKRLDAVTITTEYDKITEIKANSVFSKVTGKIVSLTMAKPSNILKVLVNTEEKVFSVSSHVPVVINNASKSLFDLKIDQLVELELENEEVIDIEARDDLKQKQVSGVINSINTSSRTIRILYYDTNSNTTEKKTITYKYETRITSTRAQMAIGAGALKVNDQIIIIGEEIDDVFVAEKILLMD